MARPTKTKTKTKQNTARPRPRPRLGKQDQDQDQDQDRDQTDLSKTKTKAEQARPRLFESWSRSCFAHHYDQRSVVRINPMEIFGMLLFAVVGQTPSKKLKTNEIKPYWIEKMFRIVFGVYLLVSVIVLTKLLIAMMSDTYQRIQAQSDIEWKFGLSKLIRSMHHTTTSPAPMNLITTWVIYLCEICKCNACCQKRPSTAEIKRIQQLNKKRMSQIRKYRQFSNDSYSIAQFNRLDSQANIMSIVNRLENVVDWQSVVKEYRGLLEDHERLERENVEEIDSEEEDVDSTGSPIIIRNYIP